MDLLGLDDDHSPNEAHKNTPHSRRHSHLLLSEQVRGHVDAGDQMAAIAVYRRETGANLKTALSVIKLAFADRRQ